MATKTILDRGTMTLTGSGTVDTVTISNANRSTNIVITALTNTGTVYATVGDSGVSAPSAGTGEEYVVAPAVGFRLTIPIGQGVTTIKLLASAATTVNIQVN